MNHDDHPIRIRIGQPNAGDRDTGLYTDATFEQAAAALQGVHDDESDWHRDTTVYVVGTHAETHTVPAVPHRRAEVTYQQGEPVFGAEVTVYGRQLKYGEWTDAQVTWASASTMTTDDAAYHVTMMNLAIQIARAANAAPPCPKCQARAAERAARDARLAGGQS